MTQITIKTGIVAQDGQEEVLTEHFCDWPGCTNVAEHVISVAYKLRAAYVACREHAEILKKRAPGSGAS